MRVSLGSYGQGISCVLEFLAMLSLIEYCRYLEPEPLEIIYEILCFEVCCAYAITPTAAAHLLRTAKAFQTSIQNRFQRVIEAMISVLAHHIIL